MSTSVTKKKNLNALLQDKRKIIRILYAAAAIFLFVFQLIYEHFSHGVTSYFMVCAFLIPVAGLILSEIVFILFERSMRRKLAAVRNAGDSDKKICRIGDRQIRAFDLALQFLSGAVIWFSLGSVYEGVLEIYGTTNHLVILFGIAGLIQIAAAVIAAAVSCLTQ